MVEPRTYVQNHYVIKYHHLLILCSKLRNEYEPQWNPWLYLRYLNGPCYCHHTKLPHIVRPGQELTIGQWAHETGWPPRMFISAPCSGCPVPRYIISWRQLIGPLVNPKCIISSPWPSYQHISLPMIVTKLRIQYEEVIPTSQTLHHHFQWCWIPSMKQHDSYTKSTWFTACSSSNPSIDSNF